MGRKRKLGGGRKPSKPDYNPSAILQNQMDAAVALYSTDAPSSLQVDHIGVRHQKLISGTSPSP